MYAQAQSAWGQGQQSWGQQPQAWGGQQQAQGGQQQQAQQAWGGQAAPQAAAPAAGQNKDVTLIVTGCTHATVGGIIRGTFQLHGENHGKPTYKRDAQVNGLDVMSYYWDERDGAGFCGWWFGPKVGGDQVWAYHTEKAAMPPQSGWKVPYDGPVDTTLAIQYKPKGQAAQPQAQAQAQPAWGQQAAAQPQQGAWGAQAAQMAQQQQARLQEQQRLEEQRRQLEGLKQKQQLEQTNRAQEMRQKQMMEQQQKLQANKMALEMANTQRIEQQKQKMEAMKQQQQELIAKRAEEHKRKEEELGKKKLEQASVLTIRRTLQKFKASSPDTFEANRAELEEALTKEAEALGSQKEAIGIEVEKAVTSTKQRIDQMKEVLRKAEEKKIEAKRAREEQKEKATALLAELEGLVMKAESSGKGLAEEAEPLTGDKEMKLNEIEACATTVEASARQATDDTKAAADFAVKEQPSMKNVPPMSGEPPSTVGADLAKLMARIAEVKKSSTLTLAKFATSKVIRVKKAQAKAKYDKLLASFKKFDMDKDGMLSRREIQNFSKGEFTFSIPIEALDNICTVLIKPDAKGVEKDNFHRLKIMIGVAREAAMDAKRKAAKEKREKHITNLKEKLVADIKSAAELITAATEAVVKAEKEVAPLSMAKAKESTALEMVAFADASKAVIDATTTIFAAAKDAVTELSGETEPELRAFATSEVKKLQNQLSPLEQRSAKSSGVTKRFRDDAAKKNAVELEKLRADGLAMIFHHQGAKKLLIDGLYAEFDKKKRGKIDESAFVRFFNACAVKDDEDENRMSEDGASRLFAHLDETDKGFIPKETFLNLIRRFMKVLKASVLTEDMSTKSKPLRRLNEGEVLECFTGPTEVDGEEIQRIKVKATSDGVEGWVTPVGNRGTVFLADGGNMFKVVKETILTGSFVIGADVKGHKDRKMKVGEVVEVREWPKKEDTSGMVRMKVRVKSDGSIGWVTSVGNTGITFLEVV